MLGDRMHFQGKLQTRELIFVSVTSNSHKKLFNIIFFIEKPKQHLQAQRRAAGIAPGAKIPKSMFL